jgi:hypothetical protein
VTDNRNEVTFAGFRLRLEDIGDDISVWRVTGRIEGRSAPEELVGRSFPDLETAQRAIFRYLGT